MSVLLSMRMRSSRINKNRLTGNMLTVEVPPRSELIGRTEVERIESILKASIQPLLLSVKDSCAAKLQSGQEHVVGINH